MKTKNAYLILLFFISTLTLSAQLPTVVKDWAVYAGNVDSTFKTPVLTDSIFTYVATFTVNTTTGADILITKYDNRGEVIWQNSWTGPGNGRDQASDIAKDSLYIYLSGVTYTSTANNFDFVVLKLSKLTGSIVWSSTYNSPASNYDVATAIGVGSMGVYVTGVSNSGTGSTSLDYKTIKYNKSSGSLVWERNYDYIAFMDMPFDLAMQDDTTIVVTGGSEGVASNWDYATIKYGDSGNPLDTIRVTGIATGFDHARAVKSDLYGNIYITGGVAQSSTNYDIKTVRINVNGTVAWQDLYDYTGSYDEGMDLLVDADSNVYVAAQSTDASVGSDYLLIKYNYEGTPIWTVRVDVGGVDEVRKMCFDSYGNIVMTGKVFNISSTNYDFLTVAIDPEGTEIWRDFFGENNSYYDGAEDIAADAFGNIYVTGVATINGDNQTVTIKYRTDYYTDPMQIDTPSIANYFYTNYGQIADSAGNPMAADSLHYYTIHHSPQLFFETGKMNMVFSHLDRDSSTTDTLQRVDVSFRNNTKPSKAIPLNEMTDNGYYNYYLSNCPSGVTNVHGYQKLIFKNVSSYVDAMYSSNNAGLKLYFICSKGFEPTSIGLIFEGQDDLQIINNWGLQVTTSVGSYVFEKPRVYQIDSVHNSIVSLPWQLDWNIPNSGEAEFLGWGSYDSNLPLIIEIGPQSITPFTANIGYSTYTGGPNNDASFATAKDESKNIIVTGHTTSTSFPLAPGQLNLTNGNFYSEDAYVFKSDINGVPKWGTLYGGTNIHNYKGTIGRDVDVDGFNNVYVVGTTDDSDLIQTTDTTLSTFPSPYHGYTMHGYGDHFIIKLNKVGQLKWANYFGGTNSLYTSTEERRDVSVTVDRHDSFIYMAGSTVSTDLPVHAYLNGYNQTQLRDSNQFNGYILRLDTNGAPSWCTYFGGDHTAITDIQVIPNPSGTYHLYIAGSTRSKNYDSNTCSPPHAAIGFPNCNTFSGEHFTYTFDDSRGYIAEFNKYYQLVWSTILGNDSCNPACPITMGPHCLTGFTNTIYLGIQAAFDDLGIPLPACNGCFRQGSNPDIFNTLADGYIARFDDRSISWATFLGGDDDDRINALYTDGSNLYVTGYSNSSPSNQSSYCMTPTLGEFPLCDHPSTYYFQPTINTVLDAFVTVFDENDSLWWSTYIGGNKADYSYDIIKDSTFLYITGITISKNDLTPNSDYPQQYLNGAYNQNTNAGNDEGFLTRFDASLLIGIEKLNEDGNSPMIFPNPCSGKFNLLFYNQTSGNFKYSITNLLGETLQSGYTKMNTEKIISFDLRNYADGIYLIHLETGKEIFTGKIIKQ